MNMKNLNLDSHPPFFLQAPKHENQKQKSEWFTLPETNIAPENRPPQ